MSERGVTQQELSKSSGVSQGTISKYRSNKQTPKSKELYAISKALGVKMEYWFGEQDVDIPNQNYSEWKNRAVDAERKLSSVKSVVRSLTDCVNKLEGVL
jgi:transcriptional regulator with XRE-family HTH domain